METLTPKDIADQIGAPSEGLIGSQDWVGPLYPDVTFSMLHYEDGTFVPFRVLHSDGTILSKLKGETSGDVDAAFNDALSLEQHKNREILPPLMEAIPDLDPGNENIVRGLSVGGKEMIGDLVNGQIVNLREPAVMPTFSVNDSGKLIMDTSGMSPDHAAIAEQATATAIDASPVIGVSTVLNVSGQIE